MQGHEKNNHKGMYMKVFILVLVFLGALLYWPRFDLVVMVWVFAVLFFINDRLDEQLADQPHVTEHSSPEANCHYYFYYKDVLATENSHRSSVLAFAPLYFLMGLPRKAEPWDLMNIVTVVVFLSGMVCRYFYLKYFDSVKDDNLPANAPKKSRHFLYLHDTVLKEFKGKMQWQVQVDQMTAIDLGDLEVWIFYREQDQIKQYAIRLVEWERLSELRQKFRVIEQRLKSASV